MLLKLIAHDDRPEIRQKDARDIAKLSFISFISRLISSSPNNHDDHRKIRSVWDERMNDNVGNIRASFAWFLDGRRGRSVSRSMIAGAWHFEMVAVSSSTNCVPYLILNKPLTVCWLARIPVPFTAPLSHFTEGRMSTCMPLGAIKTKELAFGPTNPLVLAQVILQGLILLLTSYYTAKSTSFCSRADQVYQYRDFKCSSSTSILFERVSFIKKRF